MTRNAITAESRDRQALARAIAAAAIAKANLKAGTADERNLNTMIGILTLPRLGWQLREWHKATPSRSPDPVEFKSKPSNSPNDLHLSDLPHRYNLQRLV